MTFRIEKDRSEAATVVRLIGELHSSDLEDLATQLKDDSHKVEFDLDELSLVDAAVVRFLGASEESGIELRNCPPYIREWIKREKKRQ